jgi:hypothetical protein
MQVKKHINPIPGKEVKALHLSDQASPVGVRALINLGYIGPKEYLTALKLCRKTRRWDSWFKLFTMWSVVGSIMFGLVLMLMTLSVGGSSVLLVFMVDALIIGAAAVAFFLGLNSAVGKFLLFVIILLGGAALGMIGRIYPIYVETWQLMTIWTTCSSFIVMAGRSAFLTALWIGMVNLCLVLFGFTVLMPEAYLSWPLFAVIMALLNLAMLLAREKLTDNGYGIGWLDRPYLGLGLTMLSFGYVSIPALAFFARINTWHTVVGLLVFTAMALYIGFFYALKHKNIPILLSGFLWGAVLVVFFLFRVIVVNADEANLQVSIGIFIAVIAMLQVGVLYVVSRLYKLKAGSGD